VPDRHGSPGCRIGSSLPASMSTGKSGHTRAGNRAGYGVPSSSSSALMRELDELVALISSVQAPALLLADPPKDKVVPIHTARRLAQALPNGRLQLVEGAGHHLPRRAPGAVADAVAAFLRRHAPCECRLLCHGRDLVSSGGRGRASSACGCAKTSVLRMFWLGGWRLQASTRRTRAARPGCPNRSPGARPATTPPGAAPVMIAPPRPLRLSDQPAEVPVGPREPRRRQ
jgi:TAP-like protein